MYASTSNYNPPADRPRSSHERHYELRILQQPVRARMCGFGDKDRRLLTPPVIVELLVYDSHTGMHINADEVDTSFFVLNADLWDSRGTNELNIVMHPVFCNPESTANYQSSREDQAPVPGPSSKSAISNIIHPGGTSSGATPPYYPRPALDSSARPNGEMAYTRNLIGALAQSASKLKGMDGQPGIFFIFHDLSVRTEGIFCLRFTFVVLGNHIHNNDQPTDTLATTFSEPFQCPEGEVCSKSQFFF
ncbi:uncharacterized protein PGTG_18587 [Puccinia graminis f. sp. tritici CRL 75-36-700-3]|uniref:Velvet domain-containing protein n=1 Tax=Puccinia graminis f. sp. tritici (strain CRL 75-36-700-3 / race SCCL) TaxID=418459 RepID=E3L8D3_PUCGT|nr:uncharacterized protein PGTG_18587 [Puccinia graminis f. sp. tritici CRL 75-36-700-3]EFP92808.2 hypothetical protein PGTG_18587 [Puccinia graminis f. sp. tritici CRL 75-36-700-3]